MVTKPKKELPKVLSEWTNFLQSYRNKNPKLSYKDAVEKASSAWHKMNGTKKVEGGKRKSLKTKPKRKGVKIEIDTSKKAPRSRYEFLDFIKLNTPVSVRKSLSYKEFIDSVNKDPRFFDSINRLPDTKIVELINKKAADKELNTMKELIKAKKDLQLEANNLFSSDEYVNANRAQKQRMTKGLNAKAARINKEIEKADVNLTDIVIDDPSINLSNEENVKNPKYKKPTRKSKNKLSKMKVNKKDGDYDDDDDEEEDDFEDIDEYNKEAERIQKELKEQELKRKNEKQRKEDEKQRKADEKREADEKRKKDNEKRKEDERQRKEAEKQRKEAEIKRMQHEAELKKQQKAETPKVRKTDSEMRKKLKLSDNLVNNLSSLTSPAKKFEYYKMLADSYENKAQLSKQKKGVYKNVTNPVQQGLITKQLKNQISELERTMNMDNYREYFLERRNVVRNIEDEINEDDYEPVVKKKVVKNDEDEEEEEEEETNYVPEQKANNDEDDQIEKQYGYGIMKRFMKYLKNGGKSVKDTKKNIRKPIDKTKGKHVISRPTFKTYK